MHACMHEYALLNLQKMKIVSTFKNHHFVIQSMSGKSWKRWMGKKKKTKKKEAMKKPLILKAVSLRHTLQYVRENEIDTFGLSLSFSSSGSGM